MLRERLQHCLFILTFNQQRLGSQVHLYLRYVSSLRFCALSETILPSCMYVYCTYTLCITLQVVYDTLAEIAGQFKIQASAMPLVTDLANFLSMAEVKAVTRYEKPNKMTHTHTHAQNVINKTKRVHVKHMDPCQHTLFHKSLHMIPTHNFGCAYAVNEPVKDRTHCYSEQLNWNTRTYDDQTELPQNVGFAHV